MISSIKNIFDSLKKSNSNNQSPDTDSVIEKAKFTLSYKELVIGYLEFLPNDNTWSFSYSEEFKNQNSIAPIISFPDTNQIYHGKELWSFFSSRIPDNVGLSSSESKSTKENKTLINLLKSYGHKTITNPFDLSIA